MIELHLDDDKAKLTYSHNRVLYSILALFNSRQRKYISLPLCENMAKTILTRYQDNFPLTDRISALKTLSRDLSASDCDQKRGAQIAGLLTDFQIEQGILGVAYSMETVVDFLKQLIATELANGSDHHPLAPR